MNIAHYRWTISTRGRAPSLRSRIRTTACAFAAPSNIIRIRSTHHPCCQRRMDPTSTRAERACMQLGLERKSFVPIKCTLPYPWVETRRTYRRCYRGPWSTKVLRSPPFRYSHFTENCTGYTSMCIQRYSYPSSIAGLSPKRKQCRS